MAIKGAASFKKREETVFLCEDFRLYATAKELRIFCNLWQDGRSILEIADILKRKPEEVVFMIIDQAEKKKIEPRENNCLGW